MMITSLVARKLWPGSRTYIVYRLVSLSGYCNMTQNLPSQMKAAVFKGAGGPEVIVCEERPVPRPGKGELLVLVSAAGINRPDVMQRQGKYPPPPGASDIPGLEISGEVVATGPDVKRFSVGSSICGLVAGGGYAEYCVIHEQSALPVPAGLSMTEAAAIPETFMTVWTNVFQDGGLSKGEKILIHGGSSGIGTAAIQLAKAFGASHVIVTVGSSAKASVCEKLGALSINYHEENFAESVSKLTDGTGVNLILDMVGGEYVNLNYQAAAKFGRIVQIASLMGPAKEVNLFPLMIKRLQHTGSTLRARTVEEKALVARDLEEQVWPKIEHGEIRPVIHSTFQLENVRDAHALMDSNLHYGKIVLKVRDAIP